MVADRRAAREPLPLWRKPNWVVPIVVACLNSVAIVGVAHVTARDVSPLRSSDGGTVLDARSVRGVVDAWDLRTVSGSPEQVEVSCQQHTNVTVAVRTAATVVTAVLCPWPAP